MKREHIKMRKAKFTFLIIILVIISLLSLVDSVLAIDGDHDEDWIFGPMDNCPDIANPEQEDSDRDGVGDACEKDGIEATVTSRTSTTSSTTTTITTTITTSTTTTTSSTTTSTTIPTIHDESENVEVQETINQKTIQDSAQQQTIENSSGTKYLAIIFVILLIVIIGQILKK